MHPPAKSGFTPPAPEEVKPLTTISYRNVRLSPHRSGIENQRGNGSTDMLKFKMERPLPTRIHYLHCRRPQAKLPSTDGYRSKPSNTTNSGNGRSVSRVVPLRQHDDQAARHRPIGSSALQRTP